MPQTSIKMRQAKWLAEGQTATLEYKRIAGALANAYNGNAGVLPFGRVSALDPATSLITTLAGAPAAGSTLVIPIFVERYGISLGDLINVDAGAVEIGYPESDQALVEYLTEGPMVVWTEEAVNATDPVFYRHTANGANTVVGRVRKTAGAGAVAFPNARFAESTAGPGLVAVHVSDVVRV